jgi:prevent-host-death family protein
MASRKVAKRIPRVVSALTARTQFGQILRRASRNHERFIVDRRGDPQVVIMSFKDYVDTIAPAPEWLKEIWAESKRKGTDKLTMREIDAEIAAYRKEQRRANAAQKPSR